MADDDTRCTYPRLPYKRILIFNNVCLDLYAYLHVHLHSGFRMSVRLYVRGVMQIFLCFVESIIVAGVDVYFVTRVALRLYAFPHLCSIS